jgi:hypothetical protein
MIYGMKGLDFNEDYAESIITHCKKTGMTDQEAWLHLLAAAAGLCPIEEMSKITLGLIYEDAKTFEDAKASVG